MFGVREGHIRGSRPITLVVGDDLNTIVLPDTYTTACDEYVLEEVMNENSSRVGGAQINTDGFSRHLRISFGRWGGVRVQRWHGLQPAIGYFRTVDCGPILPF